MFEYLNNKDQVDTVTRTEMVSSDRTFRDAMSSIAFVCLNHSEALVARTPFFEVGGAGGGREVGSSSQYHSTGEPPNQPPKKPLIRTETRGSQASITGGTPSQLMQPALIHPS